LVKKIKPDNTSTIYIGSIYEVQKDAGGTATGATTYYPSAGAMRVNGTLYYVLRDRLGSASVVLNDTGGTVGDTRYDPFGETRETNGSLLTDRLFTDQREMTGLGLYHFGARFYSPELGRFIQPDTLVPDPGNPQSFNRFSYVNNNPINFTDPSGNRPFGECEKNESCRRTATNNAEAARNAHLQIVSNDDMNGCKGANCNRGLEIVIFAISGLVATSIAGNSISGSPIVGNTASSLSIQAKYITTRTVDSLFLLGVKCASNPICSMFLGIQQKKIDYRPTSSNEIGKWGVEKVADNFPIIPYQSKVIDPISGKTRVFDGFFSALPDHYVEIKTSTNPTIYATQFTRNQLLFDSAMVIKPEWLFVNGIPSNPLIKLLNLYGINYTLLNIPFP
jgi:RHS repeat-associated protein